MLGKALNAVGDSRLYVVGRDGKLLFMENPYEPPETVLKNAQAAMRQGLAAK